MYSKYRVTMWSRLDDSDDIMTVFVEPWQMTVLMAIALDNCMVAKIDSGIKEPEEEEDAEF